MDGRSTPVQLTAKPDHPPIACTLDAADVPTQLQDWKVLLDTATGRQRLPDGALRVEFGDGVDLAELTRLVAAEQACCAFFKFAIRIDASGTAMEVWAPEEAADLVATMFDG